MHCQDWTSAPMTPATPCWTLRGSVVAPNDVAGQNRSLPGRAEDLIANQRVLYDPVAACVR